MRALKTGTVATIFQAAIESLLVSCRSYPYLKECLTFEVFISNKKGYVVSMFRSPTYNGLNSLTNNLQKLVVNICCSNPHFILMIGDFNTKLSKWSSNHTRNAKGTQLDYLTSLYGMKQVITGLTHIWENSSSWIDLILSNQPTLLQFLECITHYIQNVIIK